MFYVGMDYEEAFHQMMEDYHTIKANDFMPIKLVPSTKRDSDGFHKWFKVTLMGHTYKLEHIQEVDALMGGHLAALIARDELVRTVDTDERVHPFRLDWDALYALEEPSLTRSVIVTFWNSHGIKPMTMVVNPNEHDPTLAARAIREMLDKQEASETLSNDE